MKLSEIVKNTDIICPVSFVDIEISGVTMDTSCICGGEIFVCISGFHTDGHKFIADALRKGASAVIAEATSAVDAPCDTPILFSSDTRRALAILSAAFYGDPQKRLKIIGITGTNGKTTTARMLLEMLKHGGKRVGLIGTTGNYSPSGRLDITSGDERANMTTPDPEELYKILKVMEDDGAEYVVMEVTSHALALSKTCPIEFEYAIFTNLTQDHLDLHKNMENYYLAKKQLFLQSKHAIINVDDPYGRRLCRELKHPIRCTCEGRDARYMAGNIRYKGYRGLEYKLYSVFLNIRISTSIPGSFTVTNSLLAGACATEIGISPKAVKSAMLDLGGTDGRLERVMLPHMADICVFIDYAHTPDALENLLRCALSFKRHNERVVLLFGCGGDRDRDKRKIMGRIASALADSIIITSDNPRNEKPENIISDIMEGVDKESDHTVICDRREAIRHAVLTAKAGDVILLAGKGHEKYEIDLFGKHYFSEKEVVLEAYAERYENIHKKRIHKA